MPGRESGRRGQPGGHDCRAGAGRRESTISIVLFASTNAGGGEQIGFFHAEYSLDGGKTWTGITYAENVGRAATRTARFTTGAAGSKALVRVRIAFRGGPAGNVDCQGNTIDWAGSWTNWREPPAKVVTITIVAPSDGSTWRHE